MTRTIYELTEKQLSGSSTETYNRSGIPSDDEFKTQWKKTHHGRERGWGMSKKAYIVSMMRNTREYQRGIWQARLDLAMGITEYQEKRDDAAEYNLGYYTGWTELMNSASGPRPNGFSNHPAIARYLES